MLCQYQFCISCIEYSISGLRLYISSCVRMRFNWCETYIDNFFQMYVSKNSCLGLHFVVQLKVENVIYYNH